MHWDVTWDCHGKSHKSVYYTDYHADQWANALRRLVPGTSLPYGNNVTVTPVECNNVNGRCGTCERKL